VVDDLVRWFHLLAAAIWIGGMITVAALVPALRKAGASRQQIQAAARRFGLVAWSALLVSVLTGMIQLTRLDIGIGDNTALAIKLGLVGSAVILAYVHQQVSRGATPMVRGVMEVLLLVLGLAILAAAVAI
jgi:uncharacterized membrane protein